MSPLVDLDAFPDLGLIIKAPTGVRYSTQAAGLAYEHPETEGYFVPLRAQVGRPELATLFGLFRGSWERMSVPQANLLDSTFNRHGFKSIRVDRSLLDQSREAWIHVIVSPNEQGSIPRELMPLAGLSEEARGVVIWPNRD